jgi:hypothetical protein
MKDRRCLGLTKTLHRCSRKGEWGLFCQEHKKQPLIWACFLLFTVVGGIASIYSAFFSQPHAQNELETAKHKQVLSCVFEYGVHLSGEFEKLMYIEYIRDNDPADDTERERFERNLIKIFFHLNESKFFLDQIGLNIDARQMVKESSEFSDMEEAVNRVGDLIKNKIEYSYGIEAKYFFNIGTMVGGVGYRAILAKKYSTPELVTDYKRQAYKIDGMLNEIGYDLRIKNEVQDVEAILQNIEAFYHKVDNYFRG